MDLITIRVEFGFQTRVCKPRKIRWSEMFFPSMVSRFFLGISHLLRTRVVPLGLNGSDVEQMGNNRDGRLPLELVEIWNEYFGSVM